MKIMTKLNQISVIITTYNAPDYLRRVLAGYLRQTRMPDEIVVADDGSTDETAAVIKDFRTEAPFSLQHVWHEDQGFRAAKIRNEAIKASQGSYLIFTDGDCIPDQSFVEDHEALAAEGWFVQGKRMLVSKRSSANFKPGSRLGLALCCLRGELRGCHHLLRIPGFVVSPTGLRGVKTCNLALHRDMALSVNGFNEVFVGWGREDAEFVARLVIAGYKRKDPLFSALLFHLWHQENSRDSLECNDNMLADALKSGSSWCNEGIVKG